MDLTLLNWLRARPGFPFGLLMALACIQPLISPSMPFGLSFTLFDMVNYAVALRGFAVLAPGYHGTADLAFLCFYLLYAVPIAAGWLLIREATAGSTDRLRLTVGLVGLLTPVLVFALSAALLSLSLPPQEGRRIAGSVLQLLTNPGVGWILMIASSVALIAVGRGWRPFGLEDGAG
jgi:hypothetical protein